MKNKYNMTLEDNIMYAKRNIVDSIYSEARLEGIGVTYPDTQELYEGRAVAGLSIEDTIKVNNLKHAWRFVLDNIDYPLDLSFIRQVNTEIGKGIVMDEGKLRLLDVKIGGTSWRPEMPDEEKVKAYISQTMGNDNLSDTQKAIDTMLYIMRSQLFMDGNKRTAQLVANKIMINSGAGIICIPVNKQRDFVSHLIDFYESGSSDVISKFVYEHCVDGFNRELPKESDTSKKHRQVGYDDN